MRTPLLESSHGGQGGYGGVPPPERQETGRAKTNENNRGKQPEHPGNIPAMVVEVLLWLELPAIFRGGLMLQFYCVYPK